jgi:hypothetical protein
MILIFKEERSRDGEAVEIPVSGSGVSFHGRGDGGKMVFEADDDRLVFLKRLEETCGSCGWRVHAWVLMGKHFHLLL